MLIYDKEKLLKIVKKNEETEIDCLKKLVSIPTCYDKHHDMKPIITQLTDEFEKRGYRVQTFSTSGAPVMVAELNRGMRKTLLFYNHYDVQPEEPLDEWKSPPYELSMRNDRLYGRGVRDNKGSLVATSLVFRVRFRRGMNQNATYGSSLKVRKKPVASILKNSVRLVQTY